MIGAYWVIIDKDRNILIEKELFSNKQEMNTTRIAEAIILLDMIQIINNKSYDIMNMNLTVAIDNEAVQQMIHREIVVPNHYNQDASAQAYTIKRIQQ